MSARDDLIDEYGRATTAPLGTLAELSQKLDAYRAEVLAEAAEKLDRIADETERQVAARYGESSGIGPGSADMVREAARSVRGMVTEKASAKATPAPTAAPLLSDDDAAADALRGAAPATDATTTADEDGIYLALQCTPEQWTAWQAALGIDPGRMTLRDSVITSHATWRGRHVAIRCYIAKDSVGTSAPTAAPDERWTPDERRQRLLIEIQTRTGRWGTSRAEHLYQQWGVHYPRSTGRADLRVLHAEGHLTAHGPTDGRYYLRSTKGGRS